MPNQLAASCQQPLQSRRIIITRSATQADAFRRELSQLGAEPIVFPVIRFVPLALEELNTAFAQLEQYDWVIFTSINAVEFFFCRVDELGLTLNMPRVATVGSATAAALQVRRIPIHFTPDEFTGKALAVGLGDLTGQRVLLPRALIGRPEIVKLLRRQGAEVDDMALYDTITAVPTSEAINQIEQGFDVVTFTSPSSVRNFLKIIDSLEKEQAQRLSQAVQNSDIACIGPATADEARLYGLPVAIMPGEYTIDGLVQAIKRYFNERET